MGEYFRFNLIPMGKRTMHKSTKKNPVKLKRSPLVAKVDRGKNKIPTLAINMKKLGKLGLIKFVPIQLAGVDTD